MVFINIEVSLIIIIIISVCVNLINAKEMK